MSLLADLGTFVATASADQLASDDRALQRRHFIDTVAAAVAGAHTEEGRTMRPLFGDDIADRIALLAATIRLSEVDDIDLASCTTPGSAIVPVVCLTALPRGHVDPATLAAALWCGYELLVRFGTAIDGPHVLQRQVWPTYLLAPLGAAAAAARLLGLDARQAANALSIALTFTAGGSGTFNHGRSPRWLLHAVAVRCGWFAVQAAQAGYDGDLSLLDRDWLANSHGIALDRRKLMARLGEGTIYRKLSMKPYCSAKQAIAATDGLRQILDAGVAPDTISSITVRVPPLYARMIDLPADPHIRPTTYVSVRYLLALVAYHPQVLNDIARDGVPWDDAILSFMSRVTIEPDESLLDAYPQSWPAEVVVKAGGETHHRKVLDAPGDPGRPFNDAEVVAKAHDMLDRVVGAQATDRWVADATGALAEEGGCEQLSRHLLALLRDG